MVNLFHNILSLYFIGKIFKIMLNEYSDYTIEIFMNLVPSILTAFLYCQFFTWSISTDYLAVCISWYSLVTIIKIHIK